MNAQHSTPRADHHVEPHSDRDRHHPQHLDPQARPGRRWLRILLPALLILAWLAVTGIGGPYFGKISEVTSESATDRLPASAQSTEVAQRLADFKESDAIPAIVVLENPDGITEQDTAWAQQLAKDPGREVPLDGAASPAIPAEDGKALQIVLPLDSGAQPDDAVTALRERLNEAPEGLRGWVTGPAGFTADLAEAFSGIDGILLAVALVVVFVILLAVYRSPLLPILVLLTSLAALSASILVIWHLADAAWLSINGQIQGILFILVIGAATDYSLLFVARYREALQTHRTVPAAMRTAWRGTIEPVAASGGTVIAGLLCLMFSSLKTNAALGPVAATGIVFAMLAALTLLPALLLIFGRVAFWPARPRFRGEDFTPPARLWGGIARRVGRRARPIWLVSAAALVIMAAFALQFRASGVPQSELILGHSDARDGQQVQAEHFPGGSGTPAQVVVAADAEQQAGQILRETDGVDSVSVVAADSPTGTVPLDQQQRSAPPYDGAQPTVAEGDVMLEVTLADAPDSAAAEDTVQRMRDRITAADAHALVGGTTAQDLDTLEAASADRALIIPIILAVITVILMLLLRSILAPLLLVATTVVSYLAALGVGALVFHHLLGFSNADPTVPLYAFVFLVALGIDYNIFLMTRVREESLSAGTREGVLRGLRLTGGVITAAGVVLAATFAALAVIPLMFLAQLAFLVAFGVLLDTTLVRALLVPALVHDIGDAVWWPSKLRHGPLRSRD
ncbi:MMPL family transporter [Rothia kristinae]|uniref:MMPL family transporter n=1 Tax=Rothia kristinae TaxID=37923 RepID=UPI001E4B17C9|nr:efflux RND transporter permease subunit [Rothia kristinae]